MKKNFSRIKRAKEGEIKSLSEVELKRWIGVTLRELIRLTRALGLLLLSHWAMMISLDQNKLFVSESLPPLTQFANGYKEPTKQFSEL